MHLLARLYSECESDYVSQSVEIDVERGSNLHYWSNASLVLENYTLGYNDLVLEFLLKTKHGTFLVTRKTIPSSQIVHYPEDVGKRRRSSSIRTRNSVYESFSRISTVHHSLRVDDIIGFSYVAYMYKDIKDDVTPLGQIQIYSISLEYDLSTLQMFQGHRITCMINDTYLGRAQECITCETARYLGWKPVDADEPWPVSPRSEEDFELLRQESAELRWIRRSDPAGIGAKRLNEELKMVADNDAFSNPVRRLPRYMTLPLRVRVFNFKFNPPRSVETVIKQKDFENSTSLLFSTPRKYTLFARSPAERSDGMIERQLLPNLTLRISFTLDAQGVTVDFIKLHIAQYETTLDMDKMQQAKTV